MKLQLIQIILIKIFFLTNLIYAQNEASQEIECRENFISVFVNGKYECIAQCPQPCINAYCAPEIKCICYDYNKYEHNPENHNECIEKKNEIKIIEENNIELKLQITTIYSEIEELNETTTILPEENEENDLEYSSESVEQFYLAPLKNIYNNTNNTLNENIKINYTEINFECDLYCYNGKCFNGTCYCPYNYQFNNILKSCEIIQNDSYNSSDSNNDSIQTNNHSKFFIIGYVILAMILLLAILSVIIITLLLKDNGSAYNVQKYEKKYGSQQAKRYSDETELHDIPLRKDTDNKYYDAERFLDDRKHI